MRSDKIEELMDIYETLVDAGVTFYYEDEEISHGEAIQRNLSYDALPKLVCLFLSCAVLHPYAHGMRKEVILEIINDERRIIFALRFRSDCVGNQKVFSSAEKRVKEDSVIVLSCVSVTAAAVILGQVKFFKLRCSREPAFLIETQTANDLVGYSSGK